MAIITATISEYPQAAFLLGLKQELSPNKAQVGFVSGKDILGFIFQSHNLLKSMTVWENVTMPLKLHPDIKDHQTRAITMLTVFGLSDRKPNLRCC